MQSTTPRCTHHGLGSFHFARRYFGNRGFFLLLGVLRCFSSPRSLLCAYRFSAGYRPITTGGFPHSEIHGYIGYLLLPVAYRSLSRPSSAPDAKAFPLRSFQLDLSPFSQRLVREFLVLFENYAGFTKIEIVCHPASFRMLFHNQFVSSVSPQRNLSVALLAFVTLFSFQGADRRPQAFACLRHSFQPLLQSDLKIRSFDQVFKSKGKSPGGPEWARTTDLTIISRTL